MLGVRNAEFQIGYVFIQLGFSMINWQKVHLNTDLFSDTQRYLYTKQMAWLKAWLNKWN